MHGHVKYFKVSSYIKMTWDELRKKCFENENGDNNCSCKCTSLSNKVGFQYSVFTPLWLYEGSFSHSVAGLIKVLVLDGFWSN